MRNKIFSLILLAIIALIIDFCYGFRLYAFGNIFDIIYFFLFTIVCFLFFTSLTYGLLFNFKKNFTKAVTFTIICFLFSMFLASRSIAISKYWLYSIDIPLRASFDLWQQDEFLAHKAIPNADGYYEYFIDDTISGKIITRFDSLGFRTVQKENQIKSDTTNLFLGCSWTFGDFIEAEEGYPYKVSHLLNHNFINAGASAYGLAHMIQLVDSLIPKHEFNYVFVQLSPWLADRAMSFNGPIYYGYRPFPYFSDNEKDFILNQIPYNVKTSKRDWRNKKKYVDKLHFVITTGFEEEIINYSSYKLAQLKLKFGLISEPTNNKKELEIFFYKYVLEKCKEYNTTPIILKLGYKNNENLALLEMLKENVEVIDLDFALKSDSSDIENDNRFKIFHQKENGEKIYYDDHPNSAANSIFSEIIFKTINNLQ